MMTKNSIQLRIIKLFLILLIFTSCSSIKNNNSNEMSTSLDDFIVYYKSKKIEKKLKVIMISTKIEKDKLVYIINDAPEDVFYGDLNKFDKNKNVNVYMGTYKNILCEIHSEEIQKFKHIFSDLNKKTIEKARLSEKIKDKDGKNYIFDLSLLNWNPELIIIYNITDDSKNIILSNGTD